MGCQAGISFSIYIYLYRANVILILFFGRLIWRSSLGHCPGLRDGLARVALPDDLSAGLRLGQFLDVQGGPQGSWEFPKTGGPTIDTKIVGILM